MVIVFTSVSMWGEHHAVGVAMAQRVELSSSNQKVDSWTPCVEASVGKTLRPTVPPICSSVCDCSAKAIRIYALCGIRTVVWACFWDELETLCEHFVEPKQDYKNGPFMLLNYLEKNGSMDVMTPQLRKSPTCQLISKHCDELERINCQLLGST